MPRLVIQSVPRTVFFQSDAWTKSWLYHLSLQETRGEPLRVVEARFDVMGPQGLLRRDVYDEERLACHLRPADIVKHWLRPEKYERRGSCRIPANGERRMCDIVYTHHRAFPALEVRHVFRCERDNGTLFTTRFCLPLQAARQRTRLRLPFAGRWAMALGFEFFEHHGRSGGYGYDFVKLGADGLPFRGKGSRLSDWHCFGEPVLAPADGVVRAVRRDSRDNVPLRPVRNRGDHNYIRIRHAHGEESFLAHLKHDSIGVEEGQNVKEGQKLGECGNTGVTTVCPHIHLGLSVNGQGVPPMLADVRTFNPLELEDRVYTPMSVMERAVLRHGQIVENV